VAGAAAVTGAPPPFRASLAAALAILVILALPDRPQAWLVGVTTLPLELPLILLGLMLVPPRSRPATALRAGIVVWLAMVLLLKTGDFGMYAAFNRPFNPVLDLPLLASGWDLASGAVGPVMVGLGVVSALPPPALSVELAAVVPAEPPLLSPPPGVLPWPTPAYRSVNSRVCRADSSAVAIASLITVRALPRRSST